MPYFAKSRTTPCSAGVARVRRFTANISAVVEVVQRRSDGHGCLSGGDRAGVVASHDALRTYAPDLRAP